MVEKQKRVYLIRFNSIKRKHNMGALKDEHNVTTQRIWEEDASFAGL
jgi:hypothetical protein